MEFVCYTAWNALPPSSAKLFANAAKDSMFFTCEWFENLTLTAVGEVDENENLVLACVVDGKQQENVLAILPLISRKNRDWSGLSHAYGSLYSLLLAEDQQQAIVTCLAQGLQHLPFDYLTLKPIAEDDQNINLLQQALQLAGLSCNRNFRFYNWFHRTQGQAFKDYLADLPTRVRNTIARKQRKLQNDRGYEIRLFIKDDIKTALADYHQIYKTSWKANEQNEELVAGFTQRFSQAGWTRLAILYVQGKPIAAHLWFVVGAKASIFRLVYDQHCKQYSPGTLLMAYLMEYVIDTDKVDEIDFLMGNEKYKQDWMSQRRERWGLNCANKTTPETDNNRISHVVKVLKQKLFRN